MLPKEFLYREAYFASPSNVQSLESNKVLNITLDLGKTLQDMKYADCSGGFVYSCSDELASGRVRNRVIYWRSQQCTLELVEECFDSSLRSARAKLVFSDTPVLHVHIAEMCTDVYLLVCTTGGLVRFLLHHPAQLKEASGLAGDCPYSVLHSINSSAYQVCQPRGAPFRGHVRCATAWLNPTDCTTYAAYGLSGGDVQLLRMAPPGQQLQQRVVQPTLELRQSSLFDRLLGGWISGGGGGGSGGGVSSDGGSGVGGDSSADDAATSLAFWTDDQSSVSAASSPPVILLSATRDHKLRLWDAERRECYSAVDLLACLPDPAACGHLRNRGHQLRLAYGGGGGGRLLGCLYANFTDAPCFLALDGHATSDRRLQVRVRHAIQSPARDLIDLAVEPDIAWALYADPGGAYRLYGVGLAGQPSRLARCQLLEADQGPLAVRDHAARLTRAFGGREFATGSVRRALRLFLDENSLGAHLDQLEAALATSAAVADDAASSVTATTCSLDFMRSLLLDAVDTLAQEELMSLAAAACDLSAASAALDEADDNQLEERRACFVDRFYEQLQQLHAVDTAVCGLVADWCRTGFVGLVRRRFLGLLRPADTAELCHLLPEADGLAPEALSELPAMEDAQGTQDFLTAVAACQRLLGSLEPGLVDLLIGELLQLTLKNACQEATAVAARACQASPLVRRACHSLTDGGSGQLLGRLCEPVSAFATLLTALEAIDFLDDVDLTLLGGHQQPSPPSAEHQRSPFQQLLLSAWPAGELLANSLSQTVDSRLRLLVACLLIFAELPGSFAGLAPDLEARAADLLRCLGLLRWCCDLVYSPAPPHLLESLRAQLPLLLARPHLTGADAAAALAAANAAGGDCPALPVWQAFGGGAAAVRRILLGSRLRDTADDESESLANLGGESFGRELLPTAASLMHHLLSPERGGLSFPLFLLWAGQLDQLYAYTTMCLGWVRSDPATLYALRGIALLNQPGLSDQPDEHARAEAVDCLGQAVECAAAAASAGQAPPLCYPGFLQLVGLDSGDQQSAGDSDAVRASLYVHLVRVLEPLRCSAQIVDLARRGLTRVSAASAQPGNSGFQLPLLATVFKHELELGRYQCALDAMLQLADPSVQLDCLRHLVVTLSDRDQLGVLLGLSFGQLGNALVSVLEMRARAVDAGLHVYYNLLYCYHTGRADYKRAAAAMHELAARLARERGFEAAQRQARALLCAIGCLRLLEPRHQWVALPEDLLEEAPTQQQQQQRHRPCGEPQSNGADVAMESEDIDEDDDDEDGARPIRVLTLPDLELRYAVLSAQLQLSLRQPTATLQLTSVAPSACGPASLGGSAATGLDELVADLLAAGLYHEARCLLLRHGRPPTPLLEALASAAVTASGFVSTTEEAFADIKEALEEEGASAEGASPADCLWLLLQLYSERYDWPGAPGLKAITQRLLLLDYPLPAWLLRLYTERDPAGLLRLYVAYDRVEEAAELCRRLVESARLAAIAADGSASSAASASAVVAAAPRCLPFAQILQVREGLRLLGQPAQAWYTRLQASLRDYMAVYDQRRQQQQVA